jgi:hypothetical protein
VNHLIDLVLCIVFLEAILFTAWWRNTKHGLSPRTTLTLLTPGIFLILALRVAVTQGSALAIAAFLAASFIAHIIDVTARWDKPPNRVGSSP